MTTVLDQIRVFISYSHDSPGHCQEVLDLAQGLRDDGIDVNLDRFQPVPAQGWARWMRQQIVSSNHVLIVCTDEYRKRFEGDVDPGIGRGANFEGLLIESDINVNDARNGRYIPILLNGADESCVPHVLQQTTRYKLPREYLNLCRHLTGCPEVIPRPLGPRIVFSNRPQSPLTKTSPSTRPRFRTLEMIEAPRGGYPLVKIPEGTFLMGSPESEIQELLAETRDTPERHIAFERERPQRQREIPSFYLGVCPVTNAEYETFVRETGHAESLYARDLAFNRPDQPVVGVNWDDAVAYCRWAGLQLPTEAQWEYACRAGTTTRFWSGDSDADLDRVGWYRGNAGVRTQGVGRKMPNPFGLLDVHGNVCEWCLDPWTWEGYDRPTSTDDCTSSEADEPSRIIRGGCFWNVARDCRAAHRYAYVRKQRYNYLGFRPAYNGSLA